jgi:flagellar protein FlgJ
MQIDAVSNGMMPSNSSTNALKAQADAAKFSAMLEKVQQSAASLEHQANAVDGAASAEQKAAEDAKLREACQGFEAMFLGIVLKEMRDTVPKDELFGESNEKEIMQSMLDEARVQEMAKAGGMGLGDMLYEQLKREQSAIPPGISPVAQA